MVRAAVAVKKLWKSLRNSATVKGKGMKRKLASMNLLKKKKKKKRRRRVRNASTQRIPPSAGHMDRYNHYNYSDEEEMDHRFKKKLRNWSKFVSLPAMACVVGKADVEPENHFVYVTDLYASTSCDQKMRCSEQEDGKDIRGRGEKDANIWGGASQTDANMETAREERKDPLGFGGVDVEVEQLKVEKSGCSSHQMQSGIGAMKDAKVVRWNADVLEKVDTDAEVFIAKFYDEIRMQRQRSIGEYREMLDRGAL